LQQFLLLQFLPTEQVLQTSQEDGEYRGLVGGAGFKTHTIPKGFSQSYQLAFFRVLLGWVKF